MNCLLRKTTTPAVGGYLPAYRIEIACMHNLKCLCNAAMQQGRLSVLKPLDATSRNLSWLKS
jgi:hypothetical protein